MNASPPPTSPAGSALTGPLDAMPWLPYAAGAVALLLLAWLIVIGVRYLSADTETRRSIRQAARIRRTWPRLARNLGLVTTDRTPTFLQSLAITGDKKPEPRTLTPKLHAKTDPYGVTVTVKTVPKIGLEEFQKRADHLADAWECTRVSVNPDGPGKLRIRAVRREPLFEPYAYTPDGKPPRTCPCGTWASTNTPSPRSCACPTCPVCASPAFPATARPA